MSNHNLNTTGKMIQPSNVAENYISYDLPWNPGMTGNMANNWPNEYCDRSYGCVPRNYNGLVTEGYIRENCTCGGRGGYQPVPDVVVEIPKKLKKYAKEPFKCPATAFWNMVDVASANVASADVEMQ